MIHRSKLSGGWARIFVCLLKKKPASMIDDGDALSKSVKWLLSFKQSWLEPRHTNKQLLNKEGLYRLASLLSNLQRLKKCAIISTARVCICRKQKQKPGESWSVPLRSAMDHLFNGVQRLPYGCRQGAPKRKTCSVTINGNLYYRPHVQLMWFLCKTSSIGDCANLKVTSLLAVQMA